MLAMSELKLVIIVSSFEAMLAHANINPSSSGCRSDIGLVYDIVDKIFLSAVTCFRWLDMCVVLSHYLRVVALSHTAIAASHVASMSICISLYMYLYRAVLRLCETTSIFLCLNK